ncbi:TonB-dependent receptor [Sphingomonas arenae]|uniref:TonB-dependent receptor n=1 Tax=Sphingomonas arenae TaxID=2812555 RepID=UPI003013E5AD
MATAVAVPAAAQTITATLSGQVRDAQGAAVAGAVITARNEGTNQTVTTRTDANGQYTLPGLRPAPYTITATIGETTVTDRVTIAIGQSATLDLAPAAPTATPTDQAAAAGGDAIVVTGRRLVETRTSEVATNVSEQQIRRLPQTDRNFLAFTQLAPGVKYNDGDTTKGFQSGASTVAGVNVFIDGVNLKNTVLDQGVAGQQDSRGNPFAQLAVQEFRVITQNYKAEYEQASAAIVTSVTKSGTNEFHGDAFVSHTGKNLSAKSIFDKRADRSKPAFKRTQYGLSLGGPIIRDRLFFFGAYEGNDQDRASTVTLGTNDPFFVDQFGDLEGNFISPFRGDLYFGKLTFLPDDANTIDVSASRRKETDVTGFGCNFNCIASYEAAENKRNTIDTYLGKWTYRGNGLLNEASIDYLNYNYNPTSLSPESPTFEYEGIIIFGGKDGSQDIKQRNLTFRNDLTIPEVEFAGSHTFKVGIKYSRQRYEFNKLFNVQPKYVFRGPDYSFPQQAFLGLGDPTIKAKNNVFGIYAQDDWDVTDKLQLNLGIRWDRESNMFNNNYVTPANAAALLRQLPQTDYFDADDYITDGNDRPVFNMIQPRIGFSYDFFDNQSTVLFGGFGRYYDRNVFNNTLDERFRLQYTIGRFEFSEDGSPRNGIPTVAWDPAYLTREGLIALQATAITGLPELFAVKNNAKPPRTDQFSLGVRQRLGKSWTASVTGSYIRGKNGYTHLFATRQNGGTGNCCDVALANSFGYANVLIGSDSLDTRYKALFVTLDKPYTVASGWGLNVAYTLQKAEQNGNDLFSLDRVTPDDFGFRDKAGIERHTLVIGGLVDLPWGLKASTLTKLGSGQAYQTFFTTDFAVQNNVIGAAFPDKNCLGLFARCEVDVTLEKEFALFGSHRATLALDVFNLFNNKNYTSFNSFVCCGQPPENFNFGEPNALLTLPRRLQLRAAYRF